MTILLVAVIGLVAITIIQNWRLHMTIQDDFAALQAEVARNTTVEQSAVALIQGIKKQLDDLLAAGQPITSEQIKALSDQLGANDTDLAAAVTANTPAS